MTCYLFLLATLEVLKFIIQGEMVASIESHVFFTSHIVVGRRE